MYLCTLGILSNVLDRRTYQQPSDTDSASFGADYIKSHDVNGIPYEDRETNVHIRAQSYCLLDWFFSTHTFTDEDEGVIDEAYTFVFVEPLAEIVMGMSSAAESLQDYHPDVPTKAFQKQLTLCFKKVEGIRAELACTKEASHMYWHVEQSWIISHNTGATFDSMLFTPLILVNSSDRSFLSLETHADFLHSARTAGDDMFFGPGSDVQLPGADDSVNIGTPQSSEQGEEIHAEPTRRRKAANKRSRNSSPEEQVDKRKKKQKTIKRPTTATATRASARLSKAKGA